MARRGIWSGIVLAHLTLGFAYASPDWAGVTIVERWLNFACFFPRTFTFHIGLAMLAIGLAATALRMWSAGAASLPVVIWALMPALATPRSAVVKSDVGTTLTVMSANLLVGHDAIDEVVECIAAAKPDVILFQEYSRAKHVKLRAIVEADYPFCVDAPRDHAFGMAVYSRHPFVGEPELYPLGRSGDAPRGIVGLADPQIRCVIAIAGREVVVQNVHTPPPVSPSHLNEQRQLLRGLADWARMESRPVILGGDLNSTPEAVTSGWLRRAGLREVHGSAGAGRGATWPSLGVLRWVPGVRIDHIFASRHFVPIASRVGGPMTSDHLPIIATFRLDPESSDGATYPPPDERPL